MMYFDDKKVTKLLMEEIEEKKQGKRKSPSNDLAQYFLDVLYHILSSNKFRNYSNDWRDEMISHSSEKFVKHWDKFNPERIRNNYYMKDGELYLKDKKEFKGAHTFFSTIVHSSIYEIIKRQKRHRNFSEELASEKQYELEKMVSDYNRNAI